MRCPSAIEDENIRLLALSEYGLDPNHPLSDLEPIVHIAARMFNMPMAAVNMIGSDKAFFAASTGIAASDMRRDVSFCAHTITQDDVMVVCDAARDERFHDNPLVTSTPGIRFYAGVPLRSPAGHALGALCVIDSSPRGAFTPQDRQRLKDLARLASDKLELKRIEHATRQSPIDFDVTAITSPIAIVCFDNQKRITLWNDAVASILGYKASEVIGLPLDTLISETRYSARELIDTVINVAGSPSVVGNRREMLATRKDASLVPVELSVFSWRRDGVTRYGGILTDVSQRHQHENELSHLTHFDHLTGAANRSLFQHRLRETLATGAPLTLIAIDINQFKDLNDTLGASAGDRVLASAADQLRLCTRPIDTVARIAGDEFAVLLPHIHREAEALSFAEAIIAGIGRPIPVYSHQIRVTATAGIAIAPHHGREMEELMGNASLALYHAKQRVSGGAFVYVPSLRNEAVQRRTVSSELHRAIEQNEFVLFFQPQIRLSDGAVVGAEALIRWNHPQRGILPPSIFLPALESGPLAATVGNWVLETACQQLAAWRASSVAPPRMGINLFSAQFNQGRLETRVRDLIRKFDLPPQCVELEITENIILDQDERLLETLRKLRDLGVCIAFDDFGTGYASLSMLRNYPLTHIKIDQIFIRNMCSSRRDETTVSVSIDLARSHELDVIAEGVETAEQWQKLVSLSCDEVQGYYFGKPMPAQEFTSLLAH